MADPQAEAVPADSCGKQPTSPKRRTEGGLFLARSQASHPIDSRSVGTTRHRLPRTRVMCVASLPRGYEKMR